MTVTVVDRTAAVIDPIDTYSSRCDQQLAFLRSVVYNSYGACLFTAPIATYQ